MQIVLMTTGDYDQRQKKERKIIPFEPGNKKHWYLKTSPLFWAIIITVIAAILLEMVIK